MCGRYASTRSATDLAALFEAAPDVSEQLEPDYNVAPTDPVHVVRTSKSAAGRVVSVARWGLLPHWAKSPREGARMINARSETVATAKAFAVSFRKRRCLVPADGWYEWRKFEGGKQPYFMTRGDEPLVFAGLWSVWGEGDGRLLTCTVLTAEAVGELAEIHDRMPLLLPADRWEDWLGPAEEASLEPPSASFVAELELRPVGNAVGDVRQSGSQLVHRVQPVEPQDLTLF